MIVCVCHRVSDREIARHARAGMSFDEIQFELGVATQCGRCEDCARASQPVAALYKDTDPTAVQLATLIPEGKACNCSTHSQEV